MNRIVLGALAGAAGTFAIDVTTYADMAMRGREASNVPAEVVRRLAERAGAEPLGKPDDQVDERTKNRRRALGSLSGYGVGLFFGTLYGAVRPLLPGVPWLTAGVALGMLAMAATDVPAAKLEATDPSKWGAAGWLGDIVPHVVYGAVTALVFDALSD